MGLIVQSALIISSVVTTVSLLSDGLSPGFDRETELLTKGDLQSVAVGVMKKCPIAYGGATVFSFTNKATLRLCDLA